MKAGGRFAHFSSRILPRERLPKRLQAIPLANWCSTGSVSDLSLEMSIYRETQVAHAPRTALAIEFASSIPGSRYCERLRRFQSISLYSLDFYLHSPQLHKKIGG